MTRHGHRQVREQLVDWAESSRPLPSPELARFLGPLRPVPVAAGGRSWRAAVRTGLVLKVMGLLAALAVTGAAAVGVAQVALREPEPSTPVVVPADPTGGPSSSSADPTGPAGKDESARGHHPAAADTREPRSEADAQLAPAGAPQPGGPSTEPSTRRPTRHPRSRPTPPTPRPRRPRNRAPAPRPAERAS